MIPTFTFLLCVTLFAWLVGYEYWNPGEKTEPANWAQWLPYLAVTFGMFWIVSLRVRWEAYRRCQRAGSGLLLFLSPFLLFSFFTAVIVHRFDNHQLNDIGSETIVLLTGMVLSLAIAVYRESSIAQKNWNAVTLSVFLALIGVLGVAALFHPDWSRSNQLYLYRDEVRWTGPFKNPNQFGLAMALGLVLVSAFSIFSWWLPGTVSGPDLKSGEEAVVGTKKLQRLVPMLAATAGAALFLLGLYKSYSRGAWLGGFLGVLYLLIARRMFAPKNRQEPVAGCRMRAAMSRNWPGILVIAGSILIIGFWCFRDTNIRGVRRAFSVANQYDLSWRNRVDAYVGSLQIMAEHPWHGVGWGKPKVLYPEYYMSDRLTEGLAIVLNDYFTLGMSLGLPALCCLVAYIFVTLNEGRHRASTAFFYGKPIILGPAGRSPFFRHCRNGRHHRFACRLLV